MLVKFLENIFRRTFFFTFTCTRNPHCRVIRLPGAATHQRMVRATVTGWKRESTYKNSVTHQRMVRTSFLYVEYLASLITLPVFPILASTVYTMKNNKIDDTKFWFRIFRGFISSMLLKDEWFQILIETNFLVTPNGPWFQIFGSSKWLAVPNFPWF